MHTHMPTNRATHTQDPKDETGNCRIPGVLECNDLPKVSGLAAVGFAPIFMISTFNLIRKKARAREAAAHARGAGVAQEHIHIHTHTYTRQRRRQPALQHVCIHPQTHKAAIDHPLISAVGEPSAPPSPPYEVVINVNMSKAKIHSTKCAA